MSKDAKDIQKSIKQQLSNSLSQLIGPSQDHAKVREIVREELLKRMSFPDSGFDEQSVKISSARDNMTEEELIVHDVMEDGDDSLTISYTIKPVAFKYMTMSFSLDDKSDAGT